jgi:hypothetical protein
MDACTERWRLQNVLETFEKLQQLQIFDNAEWICWQWVEMILKQRGRKPRKVRK